MPWFAQRDNQPIPGRIGSDDATQEVSKLRRWSQGLVED